MSANQYGLTLFMLSLNPTVNWLVQNVATSSAARLAVEQHFAPQDGAGQIHQLTALFTLHRLENTSLAGISRWEKEYRENRARLDAAGLGLTAEQTSAHLISLLPNSLDNLKTTLMVNAQADIKLLPSPENLFSQVRAKATSPSGAAGHAAQVDGATANVASSKPKGRSGGKNLN